MNHLLQNISRINTLATYDFCPWANRYVYWLKEPVGWFVIATLASLLVGAFLSPIGWTVAAGLAAVLCFGLGFPWLAVRTTHCELTPTNPEVHERDCTQLELIVRNRLPIPIFGLTIEGYLSQPADNSQSSSSQSLVDSESPVVGLAQVPALSKATYRLAIQPEYRGRYPMQRPMVTCAFPFGIWTAKRPLTHAQPVTVWPMLLSARGELEIVGKQLAETGGGDRACSHGDFMGVRDFRQGDSLRSIHWAQSARLDSLVVCERGGPQKHAVTFELSTLACKGTPEEVCENLAWRVRIMASLVDLAVSRHVPFQLVIDGHGYGQMAGVTGRRLAWNLLTAIPLEGKPYSSSNQRSIDASSSSRVSVTALSSGGVPMAAHLARVELIQPSRSVRRNEQHCMSEINLDEDISDQLTRLFMEASRETQLA